MDSEHVPRTVLSYEPDMSTLSSLNWRHRIGLVCPDVIIFKIACKGDAPAAYLRGCADIRPCRCPKKYTRGCKNYVAISSKARIYTYPPLERVIIRTTQLKAEEGELVRTPHQHDTRYHYQTIAPELQAI